MGNTTSEYMNPATTMHKKQEIEKEKQQIERIVSQEGYRDAGLLTQHLHKVNPLTKFTVAEHTGYISPPTRGQIFDVRGLPKSAVDQPISEVPGFLQPTDRAESYLDTREIAHLQGPRQIEFV